MQTRSSGYTVVMAPRSLWTGTISFGLVSVPVRMFGATESKELRFHFVDRHDLEPVGYDKVRKDTGEHVDPDDIVRAFEIEKGRYVPLEPDDLDDRSEPMHGGGQAGHRPGCPIGMSRKDKVQR